MKIEALIKRLAEASLISENDAELGHCLADVALIDYIDNPKVRDAYDQVVKRYD